MKDRGESSRSRQRRSSENDTDEIPIKEETVGQKIEEEKPQVAVKPQENFPQSDGEVIG